MTIIGMNRTGVSIGEESEVAHRRRKSGPPRSVWNNQGNSARLDFVKNPEHLAQQYSTPNPPFEVSNIS